VYANQCIFVYWLPCLEDNEAKTDAPMETEVTNSGGGQVRYFNCGIWLINFVLIASFKNQTK